MQKNQQPQTQPPVQPQLAYEEPSFLESDAARPLRILAEYLEPLERFKRAGVHATIVFFGSARVRPDGPLGQYYEHARELSSLITRWSATLPEHAHRYVVCSGGGGGIMEAANRGAAQAGGKTVGLNISLPREQRPNPYLSSDLTFEFHYFFMRKLWFAHLARALIAFPGGFGTLDELTEVLTLAQTRKLERDIPVILYGPEYWNEIIDFNALARHGAIDPEDLKLFEFADRPEDALAILQRRLTPEPREVPGFAHSRVRHREPRQD